MAGNLFYLKGWSVTLVTGIFAIWVKDMVVEYLYISLVVLVIFWFLDGYFLSQERLYRDLYNDVAKLDEKEIDFSMDTSPYKKLARNTVLYSMFSPTLLVFYGPLLAIICSISYLHYS